MARSKRGGEAGGKPQEAGKTPPEVKPRRARTRAAAEEAAPAPRRRAAPIGEADLPSRAEALPATEPPSTRAPKPRRPRAAKPSARRPPKTETPAQDARQGDEEGRIESSKYFSPGSSPVSFEEERFVFPESYGVNRLRLMVKDPECLFAYWDVDASGPETLRREVGDRVASLARLTLRMHVGGNPPAEVLIPEGTRNWYFTASGSRQAYRAELGFTLPSGEFRPLAESNTVVMPRTTPSSREARHRVSFRAGRFPSGRALGTGMGDDPGSEEGPSRLGPGGSSDLHRR